MIQARGQESKKQSTEYVCASSHSEMRLSLLNAITLFIHALISFLFYAFIFNSACLFDFSFTVSVSFVFFSIFYLFLIFGFSG